jgi:hypothetical protein
VKRNVPSSGDWGCRRSGTDLPTKNVAAFFAVSISPILLDTAIILVVTGIIVESSRPPPLIIQAGFSVLVSTVRIDIFILNIILAIFELRIFENEAVTTAGVDAGTETSVSEHPEGSTFICAWSVPTKAGRVAAFVCLFKRRRTLRGAQASI